MNTSMTASELQAFIKAQFPTENERCEWKEWRSLKSNISGRKGDDLVSYVSALANMDGGCIDILPAVLDAKEKDTKVKNLRTALRLRGLEGVFIEVSPSGPSRGAGALWRIRS